MDFEAELEKFQPSLEVEQAGEAVGNSNTTDVTDLLQSILSGSMQADAAADDWE